MKKIFITGGTGLVGSHLLYTLSLVDNELFASKREESDISKALKIFSYYSEDYNKLFEKINWIDVDITNIVDLEDKIDNIDEIYHCAALVSYQKRDKGKMLDVNIDGTANLVNYALQNNINKFCHVSSIASFGVAEVGQMINEQTDWEDTKTTSAYSKSKYFAEQEVWRGIAEGLNAVIVNPSVILGAGNWNSSSSVIFSTIDNGMKFYTKGITGFVDVRDLVNIMIELMDKSIFNENFIVSSENISYQKLFNLIAENISVKKPSIYANKKLTSFAWRVEFAKSILFNQKAVITKQSAITAHKTLEYSNVKIVDALDYKFKKLKKTIQEISVLYLNDKKN